MRAELRDGNFLIIVGPVAHYRRPWKERAKTRQEIVACLIKQGVKLPIMCDVNLVAGIERPKDGGDLQNLVQGLCQALDGSTMGKRTDAPLSDDGQIVSIVAVWI